MIVPELVEIVALHVWLPAPTPPKDAVNEPLPDVDPDRDPAPEQLIVIDAEAASDNTDAVAVIVEPDDDPDKDPCT
ncbi:hypothetical protein [Propionibacterium freudenreichii]|uniref:hypothetical protein n=1 Tax=Propionibacterium freudenreichii TaxID=1744 RepID=UPI00049FA79D|nr:hypothetical protein [Propionibacterium freudenreichii]MCT2979340.1 hypothetical protein [Propionibacterium freudenreichii]MCT2992235.1 hypothetical protein [Propionibacterium freudenreichii]MCT3003478.1 hypothetical protein [Propionibacterium freudenreichii]MCT3018929.1 hypothetical protein [Propionibacterium freudenreichii]MDK9301850.1 hypothetical protein [Propionibacterium freudenreichii]